MKFVHLIEINATDNPLIDPLSRDQLWRGLVLRAERPTLFVLALDHVPQQNEIPASDLTMTIEEPATGALFVRFEYDDHQAASDDAEAEFYNGFRRDAYKESDIDTVRKIRELAMEGQLDAPLQ